MAITPTSISKRYKLLNAGNLDWWWGPWASIAQANNALPSTLDADGVNVRQGKFVAIGNSVGGYVVHWWNNNYADGGLVPFDQAGSPLEIPSVGTYTLLVATTPRQDGVYHVVSDDSPNGDGTESFFLSFQNKLYYQVLVAQD